MLLFPLFCTIILDILKYQKLLSGVDLSLFDDDERVEHYYSWIKYAAASQYGKGIDLGFNFYNGDYTKTKQQSQTDKFEYAFNELGLSEGDRVIDIGCGFGDWLYFLKHTKKCSVLGVNITEAQSQVVRRRGIECITTSWKDFSGRLDTDYLKYKHSFDCVSLWDTIEHYVRDSDLYDIPRRKETYSELFRLCQILLDKETKVGSVWSSTLHGSRHFPKNVFSWAFWKEWINCYFLSITYSGSYPCVDEDYSLSWNSRLWFYLVHRKNVIEDYRMTSVLNDNHFGNFRLNTSSVDFWLSQLTHLLLTPHYLLFLFNQCRPLTAWMWHIGGIEQTIDPNCPTVLYWDTYTLKRIVDTKIRKDNCHPRQNRRILPYCKPMDSKSHPSEYWTWE